MKLCYVKEALLYSDIDKIQLNNIQAEKIVRKISNHFKITWVWINKKPKVKTGRKIKVSFNRINWSIAYSDAMLIEFHKNPDLLTVAHECAHILANRKNEMRCHHNKKFNKEVKRICNYIRKKNYFNLA